MKRASHLSMDLFVLQSFNEGTIFIFFKLNCFQFVTLTLKCYILQFHWIMHPNKKMDETLSMHGFVMLWYGAKSGDGVII